MDRGIFITATDLERLKKLIENEKVLRKKEESKEIRDLEKELNRAVIVKSENIPHDIITMNSKFILVDLNSNEEIEYSLVYPENADFFDNKISIIAPIGTAMLGYKEGDEIDWHIPDGVARFKIKKIIYQPESEGAFEL